MITPAFDLNQDPDFLILNIQVPYTRTSEFDIYIDGTDFKFYAKPYFLRLTLPGRIVENGREKAKFDIDKGLFTLRVPKETPGENFEGLELLTSLLAPKGSRSAAPLVQDLSSGCSESVGDEEEEEDEEEFDWQIDQQVYTESSEEELRAQHKYGFANQRSGVFARLQEELSDVIDIKNPEGTTAAERRQARLEAEMAAFSPDHYLADLFEDDEVKRLMKVKGWWTKLSPSADQEGQASVAFTDDEKEQLRKFTNRSYLLDKASRHYAWLGLADILLAYCYEVRSTEGEHSVESPWTIRKLSGTLCWLETYSCLQDVLVSFGRRVLCYPLYRHFSLVTAALRDTAKIFQSGKAGVLKCLLDVHKVFRKNEPAYILNDLYITDYCVWIQRVKSTKVTAFAAMLQKASLQKKDLGLELEELEEAATMVVAEEGEEEEAGTDSSCSSDESEESHSGRTGGGGGGGGGGGTSKDRPPPSCPSTASPLPREPAAASGAQQRADGPPSSSGGTGRLIEELGERVAQELNVSVCEEERRSLRASGEAAAAATSGSSSSSRGGTLLEPSPRRNPLLIVQTPDDS